MPNIGRGQYNYRIIRSSADGKKTIAEPAGVDHLPMARAVFDIAVRMWPRETVTLQQGAKVIQLYCPTCKGQRWVCEAHEDRPWEGPEGCECGAPAMPCPVCNSTENGERPMAPKDMKHIDDKGPRQ
jgi:hypothetical protein